MKVVCLCPFRVLLVRVSLCYNTSVRQFEDLFWQNMQLLKLNMLEDIGDATKAVVFDNYSSTSCPTSNLPPSNMLYYDLKG